MRRAVFWSLCSLIDLLARDQETNATQLLDRLTVPEREWMIGMLEEVIVWLQEAKP